MHGSLKMTNKSIGSTPSAVASRSLGLRRNSRRRRGGYRSVSDPRAAASTVSQLLRGVRSCGGGRCVAERGSVQLSSTIEESISAASDAVCRGSASAHLPRSSSLPHRCSATSRSRTCGGVSTPQPSDHGGSGRRGRHWVQADYRQSSRSRSLWPTVAQPSLHSCSTSVFASSRSSSEARHGDGIQPGRSLRSLLPQCPYTHRSSLCSPSHTTSSRRGRTCSSSCRHSQPSGYTLFFSSSDTLLRASHLQTATRERQPVVRSGSRGNT